MNGTCSSSSPPACQGAAAASQQPPKQHQEESLRAVAAEIGRSGIVDAVIRKLHELLPSAAALSHQLKRLKTLQVNLTKMHSFNPSKPINPRCYQGPHCYSGHC